MPKCIEVLFDDPSIGQIFKTPSSSSVSIEPIFVQRRNGNTNKKNSVSSFTLFCTTGHKVQGLTVEKAVIDIGDDIFTSGQAYVALSRVKSCEGVALQEFNPSKI